MKKTLLTFTLLAGLSSCTNLSEDLDMIGTQNITQTKSGNLSISENEPAIVKDLRNYISQIKLQGKQARVLTSYTLRILSCILLITRMVGNYSPPIIEFL